jgi:hypothetical protein
LHKKIKIKKLLTHILHTLAGQQLHRIQAACVVGFGSCNRDSATSFASSWYPLSFWIVCVLWSSVVWLKIAFLFYLSFPSLSFSDLHAGHAKIHISPCIFFFI